MKKTFTLLLLALFLFGCSEDDPAPNSLIGTWTHLSETYSGCNDPADDRTDSGDGYEDLIFSATTVDVGGVVLTYTTSGSTLTLTLGSDITVVTYSVSETTLTITHQESDPYAGCKIVATYIRT